MRESITVEINPLSVIVRSGIRLLSPVKRWFLNGLSCWTIVALPIASIPTISIAQIHATPYVDATYQYSSNIFALPSNAVGTLGSNESTLADHFLEERAGMNALYDWSLQELYGNFEFRHFGYDQFAGLDHNEYLLHGGGKWTLGGKFDGFVDYRQERSMVQFQDLTARLLFVQQQRLVTASGNYLVTPDWRVEAQGSISDLDSPRPGLPKLSLTEDSVQTGLQYGGLSLLSTGLQVSYLKGHFNGDEFVLTPRYDQTSVQAVVKYAATGFSTLNGALGYTRRQQQDAPTISGLTGLVDYQRSVSDFTSVGVKLSRAVNTYVTYGGTEVDTGFNVNATWKATPKVSITPSYQWTYSTYPGSSVAGLSSDETQRIDHYQLASVSIVYAIRDWLSLRPYAQWDTRHSDVGVYSFNRTAVGVDLEVKVPGQSDQPYQVSTPGS